MKKEQKTTNKPVKQLEQLIDTAAKAYAENKWKDLKARYKHHKTTNYYAYKQGTVDAMNNPDILTLVSDEVLKQAGLIRIN